MTSNLVTKFGSSLYRNNFQNSWIIYSFEVFIHPLTYGFFTTAFHQSCAGKMDGAGLSKAGKEAQFPYTNLVEKRFYKKYYVLLLLLSLLIGMLNLVSLVRSILFTGVRRRQRAYSTRFGSVLSLEYIKILSNTTLHNRAPPVS